MEGSGHKSKGSGKKRKIGLQEILLLTIFQQITAFLWYYNRDVGNNVYNEEEYFT